MEIFVLDNTNLIRIENIDSYAWDDNKIKLIQCIAKLTRARKLKRYRIGHHQPYQVISEINRQG